MSKSVWAATPKRKGAFFWDSFPQDSKLGSVAPLVMFHHKLTTQCLLIKGGSLVNALSNKLSLIFLVVVAVSVTGVKNQNCPICTRVCILICARVCILITQACHTCRLFRHANRLGQNIWLQNPWKGLFQRLTWRVHFSYLLNQMKPRHQRNIAQQCVKFNQDMDKLKF